MNIFGGILINIDKNLDCDNISEAGGRCSVYVHIRVTILLLLITALSLEGLCSLAAIFHQTIKEG